MSVLNEEYIDTFRILPKDQKEYNNTVTTNAGSFNIWRDSNVHSENVNKIKPEDVHLDRIGNKAEDKRTPIMINIEKKKEYTDKIVFSLSENKYDLLTIVLSDYRRLLYKEIRQLSENHRSADEIESYTQKLRQVKDVEDLISEYFVLHKSSEPEYKEAYMSEEDWKKYVLTSNKEYTGSARENERGKACLDSQNQ